MAIATITTNYSNRKKDINVLNLANPSTLGAQLVVPGFGKSARFCTGAQKLVQRYAIVLLTNISSQENFPAFGANFLHVLKAGVSPTDRLNVMQVFNLANYSVLKFFRAYQAATPGIPADEQLISSTLEDMSLYGDSVGFSIKLTTGAGDAVNFVLPLPK